MKASMDTLEVLALVTHKHPEHQSKRTSLMPIRDRVIRQLVATAVLGSLALMGCGQGITAADDREVIGFYEQPDDALDGPPGSIVRSEQLRQHPFDAEAWRIMYRTTDVHQTPVVATGIVVTPRGHAPDGGRTVLAWGHPTTGVADSCAPSRHLDPFLDVEGIRVMLDRGYTVVATDYVGLGTTGPDSFLVGVTAGNSLLDSARAAQSLDGGQAGTSVILWGHSQGGQAVLFAAERAAGYAPELGIEAVAAAAPAADLTALLDSHLNDISGTTIGSYAFQAYSQVYADRGAQLDTVLTPQATQILPQMNELCLLSQMSELHRIADPVVGSFFSHDPAEVEPWATLLRENSAGASAFSAPLFVAQGLDDQLVLPADTEKFIDHEKQLGVAVHYHPVEHADHGTIAYLALPALNSWLASLNL